MLLLRTLGPSYLKPILPITLLALAATACSNSTNDNGAKLEQIGNGPSLACDIIPGRLDLVKARYSAYISGSASDDALAFQDLTRLPPVYLDFVFITSHARANLDGPGNGGLTSWSENKGGRVPTTITSGTRNSSNYDAFPHELGHASYGEVARLHSDFPAALDAQYAYAVSQGHETAKMRGYSTTNREEYFADLFDEYNCSAAARQSLKDNLPTAYAFAAKYLIDPTTLFNPAADEDKDGVPDSLDLCPGSMPDPTSGKFDTPSTEVWKITDYPNAGADHDTAVKFNGCQTGQTPGS